MFWFILIALSERWRELEMRRRSLLANVTRFIQCYHAWCSTGRIDRR